MKHVKAAALRGVRLNPRADAGNLKDLFEQLNKAFAEFKANHDEQLKEVKAGFTDVVKSEKVDRLNAEVGKLQAALDEAVKQIAALQVGPGGGAPANPATAAYAAAFDRFFRKGIEAGLADLAVKAALQTQSDPDGGYTVPVEMEQAIDRVLSTVSAMRRLATVRPISTGTYKKLITITGAASGWVGETQTRPETTTPKLSALEFPAMELYANPGATQTLLDDGAVSIEQWLADEVSIVFAEQEGAAFINGTGVSQPRGILQYPTVADGSYSWGNIGFIVTGAAAGFAATNPADALISLAMALRQGYRVNGTWIMNRTIQGEVRKFKDSTGQYLWQPALQLGQPPSFLGYPIADDDNMPNLGANAFPVGFGDFRRGYVVVDRIGIRVLRDPYTNKPYVMFYTTKRVGGGVQNFEAIKLLKCSV